MVYDASIVHHASGYHYTSLGHQNSPADYYVQAALFGPKASQLVNYLNGVGSTNNLVFGQQSPTLSDVADYSPISRQAVLGWRNSDALGNPPLAYEHFDGVINEVLVYDRQVTPAEVDVMSFYLSGKYGIAVASVPPAVTIQPGGAGSVMLGWMTAPGRTYQLQYRTSLGTGSWQDFGGRIAATNSAVSVPVPVGAESTRFFRLGVVN